jgi:16S rRNA (uracil1498-N3)-methyltransferase
VPQFFVDCPMAKGSQVKITGADAHHITGSLRLATGDSLTLSDGGGRSFNAIIESASPSHVSLNITEEIVRKRGRPAPVLALALAKRTRFEWALQKVVELGCCHIIPFHSARTVVKSSDKASKIERWRQIAIEAAKQSGLPFIPAVDDPVSFAELVEKSQSFDQSIIFHEGESSVHLSDIKPIADSPTLLSVGPEGGFSDDEVAMATSSGMKVSGLGSQILRVETAAIAAVTIWQYELGNMSN